MQKEVIVIDNNDDGSKICTKEINNFPCEPYRIDHSWEKEEQIFMNTEVPSAPVNSDFYSDSNDQPRKKTLIIHDEKQEQQPPSRSLSCTSSLSSSLSSLPSFKTGSSCTSGSSISLNKSLLTNHQQQQEEEEEETILNSSQNQVNILKRTQLPIQNIYKTTTPTPTPQSRQYNLSLHGDMRLPNVLNSTYSAGVQYPYLKTPPLTDTESKISSYSEEEEEEDRESVVQDIADLKYECEIYGSVVGICEKISDFDYLCPICLRDTTNRRTDAGNTSNPVVIFYCCRRQYHLDCILKTPLILDLVKDKVPVCVQCLRPSNLTCYTQLRNEFKNKYQLSRSSSNGSSDVKKPNKPIRWEIHKKLFTYIKDRGFLKNFINVKDENNTDSLPEPCIDPSENESISLQELLNQKDGDEDADGYTLECLMNEFRLFHINDPLWQKMHFNTESLLHLNNTDLIYFMDFFKLLHPYSIRDHFNIKLSDLWNCTSTFSSHNNGISSSLRQKQKTTEERCLQNDCINPERMCVLGFDIQHLIIMGFEKKHFKNFQFFTMYDWLTYLGFKKPHWDLLNLHKNDFCGHGCFSFLIGWDIELLLQNWQVTPNERLEMGLITMQNIRNSTLPELEIKQNLYYRDYHDNHNETPIRNINSSQQQQHLKHKNHSNYTTAVATDHRRGDHRQFQDSHNKNRRRGRRRGNDDINSDIDSSSGYHLNQQLRRRRRRNQRKNNHFIYKKTRMNHKSAAPPSTRISPINQDSWQLKQHQSQKKYYNLQGEYGLS